MVNHLKICFITCLFAIVNFILILTFQKYMHLKIFQDLNWYLSPSLTQQIKTESTGPSIQSNSTDFLEIAGKLRSTGLLNFFH